MGILKTHFTPPHIKVNYLVKFFQASVGLHVWRSSGYRVAERKILANPLETSGRKNRFIGHIGAADHFSRIDKRFLTILANVTTYSLTGVKAKHCMGVHTV